MIQKEYEDKLQKILEQQSKYNCKIKLDPIDKDHLDCLWYGGEVGSIVLPDGWKITIGAYGDIRIYGQYHGNDIAFKDKCNSGRAYEDLALTYKIDDKILDKLINSDPNKDADYLVFENNNWFEVDLLTPNGEWYDLCGADNVLSDNLLDCFEYIESYFEYIDWAKEDVI